MPDDERTAIHVELSHLQSGQEQMRKDINELFTLQRKTAEAIASMSGSMRTLAILSPILCGLVAALIPVLLK